MTSLAWINKVIQRVAELPDRTSPQDWPEAMLVTADELRVILSTEKRPAKVKKSVQGYGSTGLDDGVYLPGQAPRRKKGER